MFTRFLAEYLSAEARSIFMTVERLFLSRGTLCVCVDRGERDRDRERKGERILANLPHPRIAPNLYKYRRGERVHLRAYKPPEYRNRRGKRRFGGCGQLKNDTSQLYFERCCTVVSLVPPPLTNLNSSPPFECGYLERLAPQRRVSLSAYLFIDTGKYL